MKKLISLGIASAMVASMASVSFANIAVKDEDIVIDNLKAYVLTNGAERMANSQEMAFTTVDFKESKYENAVKLVVNTGHKATVVFGLSKDCPFAKQGNKTKPLNQKVYPAAVSGQTAVKKGNNLLTSTAAVNVSVSTQTKVYAGLNDQASVCAVTFEGTNSTKTDRYSVWPITIRDSKDHERILHFCIEVPGINKEDADEADVDTNDNGIREYNDGAALRNGEYITTANLKKMKELGSKYLVKSVNGIEMQVAVSKATVDAGDIRFSAECKADVKLTERYAGEKGKVFRVAIPAFEKEKRAINILAGESVVAKVLGTELGEKIGNNAIRKMYAYPINADGYETLASAAGNDGVIDTEKVISVTVVDEKIAFEMPAGVTDVMLSTVEIDTTKLAPIPGVSVPATSEEAVNEIVAPVIGETTSATSEVVAPVIDEVSAPVIKAPAESVASQPQLEKAPAGTIAQNTGASDVVTMAIALTAILVAAAAVRSRKAN